MQSLNKKLQSVLRRVTAPIVQKRQKKVIFTFLPPFLIETASTVIEISGIKITESVNKTARIIDIILAKLFLTI